MNTLTFHKIVVYFLIGTSFLSYDKIPWHVLPSGLIFEFSVLLTVALTKFKVTKDTALALLVIGGYLISRLVFNVWFGELDFNDFIYSHKFILYLMILSLIRNYEFVGWNDYKNVYTIIIIGFVLKYTISVFLGFNDRPTLFSENNYELMFLILISIAKHENIEELSKIELLTIVYIFAMSGSRSGLVSMLLFITMYQIKTFETKMLVKIGFVISLSIFTVNVFVSRMDDSGVEDIDRFKFMLGFIKSIEHWGIVNYLFGNFIVQPVDEIVCSTFSYYDSLFSKNGDGKTCYSIIFHSFIMRCVYDYGLIGFILSFSGLYASISGKISKRGTITSVGVVLLNGLSVSSLNSVYCVLGVLTIIATSRKKNENTNFK